MDEMISKQMQAYQTNAVTTASGPQLTLMLYNGCIKFIKQALVDLENKDYLNKNKNIQKAQDIIRELMLTLDQKVALSKNLMSLYDYIDFRLIQGNIKNDPQQLEEALNYVTEIRDTWKEAMKLSGPKYVQGEKI